MTKIQIAPKYGDVKPEGFYVYIHRRASDGSEFYVGRANRNRGWHVYSGYRSPWWRRCALKNGVLVEVVQDNLSSHDADLLEEWLIAKLRHEGCRLVNITNGGGGTSGWNPSQETRRKIGEAHSVRVECSKGICFFSMSDAARWLSESGNPSASQGVISSAVSGKINTAYGMAWWLCGAAEKAAVTRSEAARLKRGTRLIRSDGMKFDSISSAVEYMKANGHPNATCGCLCSGIGGIRVRYGFKWVRED